MPSSDQPAPKHPELIRVRQLEFICEQDGPLEKILKTKLSDFFARDRSVRCADLAQIKFGEQTSVALCLNTIFGPDRGLAEKIGNIFKTVFNAKCHMDIIFLNVAQELQIKNVCNAFFPRQP